MRRRFETYKNIPIGLIIKKDLREKNMSQKTLAHIIGMSYRSLNSAINGHRLFKEEEADKIDTFFNYEKCFVINIQRFKHREITLLENNNISPCHISVPYIRPCVFWDIDSTTLDWIKHRRFIMERVSVYGNQEERKAITDYYRKIKKVNMI
ncbi:helix-turn-helix transcriptional regulator [bacterium]|nr:helix-turn-helix transcriptional regulator [Bacteroides sp.]MBD5386394.1 helix-turn-helix transcriptional regulator [bacterium]